MVYDFDLRIRSFTIAFTAALLLLPGSIHGQESPQQSADYKIAGTVRDSLGSPMPGVSVRIEKTNLSKLPETITDEKGEFFLSAPSEGTFAVRMEKAGFREVVESVTFPRKERTPLNVVLCVRSRSPPEISCPRRRNLVTALISR